MATEPQFAAIPRSPQIQIVNADGTAWKTVFTMGANGGILRALWAVSDDTAARWITFAKDDGTTILRLASYPFAAVSATYPLRQVNGLDVNQMAWLDLYEPQMHLAPNQAIKVRMESAVTSGKEVGVFALYGEF
jgi:hypothetical protein